MKAEKHNEIINKAKSFLGVLNTTRSKDFDSGIDDPEILQEHTVIIHHIANILLAQQGKTFVIDENNRRVFRFLLYYFNGSQKACEVFPDMGHTLDKNILLIGGVGTGKTLTMQIFSQYLRATGNERHKFFNVSVTQMINYHQKHNHIDAFTYREKGAANFEGEPANICLNDVGLHTHKHFGTDTKIFVENFLHARNEIWTLNNKYAHITTNLPPDALREYFKETSTNEEGQTTSINRLSDRFKTYNVLYLTGESRR